MSLAPASIRGARLKARLAVNGIQYAARSFGTLTAAGRGLLSNMRSLLLFPARWLRASYQLHPTTETGKSGPYFNSIGRFEGAQGDVQGVDEAFRIVGQFDRAVQLLAKRLDQPGSESSPGRGVDRRAAFFGPGQMQSPILLIDGPDDLDTSRGHRQRAEFRGVGAEFVERHRQRDHRAGRNLEVGTLNRELPLALTVIRLGRPPDDMREIGARPSRLQQQIVGAPEGLQPAFDGMLAVLDAGCGAQALRGDGAHRCQRVFDAVVQFFENELLQLVGGLALLGVDTGLPQQRLGLDARLPKQQAEADICGLWRFLWNSGAGHRSHNPEGLPFRLVLD